jgi:hypothetical protein
MTSIGSTHIYKPGIKKALLMLIVPFVLMSGSAVAAEEGGHVVSLSATARFERSIVVGLPYHPVRKCIAMRVPRVMPTVPGNSGFDMLVSELDRCGIVLPSCVRVTKHEESQPLKKQ